MKTTRSLVDSYLDEIRAATRTLPRAQQETIVADIEAHIEQALDPDAEEAAVRTVLDRLGTPQSIAAEAGAGLAAPPKVSLVKEVVALLGITVGSVVVPVIGWMVGVVFVWMSTIWSTKQKLAATFVWPLGWFVPVALPLLTLRVSDSQASSAWLGGLLAVVAIGAPLFVLVWLIRSLIRVDKTGAARG